MNHFPTVELKHSVSIRMPVEVFRWICNNPDGLPPSTFIIRKMEELARNDLQKDGD